jgi:hypothetical protein
MAKIPYEEFKNRIRELSSDRAVLRSFLDEYLSDPGDAAKYAMWLAQAAHDGDREFGPTFAGLIRLMTERYGFKFDTEESAGESPAEEVGPAPQDARGAPHRSSLENPGLTLADRVNFALAGLFGAFGSDPNKREQEQDARIRKMMAKENEKLAKKREKERKAEEKAADAKRREAEAEAKAADQETEEIEEPAAQPGPLTLPPGYDPRTTRQRLKDAGSAVAGGAKTAAGFAGAGAKKGWGAAAAAAPVVWEGTKAVATGGASLAGSGARMAGAGLSALYNAKPVGRIAGLLMISLLIFLTGVALVLGTAMLLYFTGAAVAVLALIIVLSPRFRQEFLSMEGLLFAFTFLIHIFYLSVKIGSLTWSLVLLIIAYLLISILFVSRGGNPQTAVVVSAASIIIYLLPFLVDKLGMLSFLSGKIPVEGTQGMAFLVAMAPIWPIYILDTIKSEYPGGWAAATLFMYKLILLFFLVLYLLVFVTSVPLPEIRGGEVNVGEDAKLFLESTMDRAEKLLDRTENIKNQITDPGQYYKGQVERSKEEKELGVAIERLRPQDPEVSNESDIIVHGNVRAKSFTGESVFVWPSCLIDKKGAPEGSVDPAELEVLYGLSQSFECTFPPMPTGSYTVKSSVTFPFQTSSYITYHLVDEERARNIARTGGEVTRELGISPEPGSIYSQGPVILTMGGSSNPILIRREGTPILPPGTTLGITIDPGWQGSLQRVKTIEIKVPEPFALGKCGDRNVTRGPESDPAVAGYQVYTFDNPDFGPIDSFQSITCQLLIPEGNRKAAAELVAEGDAVPRSFVAVVDYQFSVEESTQVRVR